MAVGFRIDFLWYQVGHGDFLHSFFSTICYRLENGQWGEKYPYLMNKLYQGGLDWECVKYAKKELEDVKKRFQKLEPSKVIWDVDNLKKQPPWGENISENITDLSNYFVTSDGRDLFSVIFNVFEESETERVNVELVNL